MVIELATSKLDVYRKPAIILYSAAIALYHPLGGRSSATHQVIYTLTLCIYVSVMFMYTASWHPVGGFYCALLRLVS